MTLEKRPWAWGRVLIMWARTPPVDWPKRRTVFYVIHVKMIGEVDRIVVSCIVKEIYTIVSFFLLFCEIGDWRSYIMTERKKNFWRSLLRCPLIFAKKFWKNSGFYPISQNF
jgi:hypothetical protein